MTQIKRQEELLKVFREREALYEGILAEMETGPERMSMRTGADACARKCKEIEYVLEVLRSEVEV